jgi:hypothetical protein
MTRFITARHRVAIAGVVVDDMSGKPVAGAHLEITAQPQAYTEKLARLRSRRVAPGQAPQRPDTTRTRPDGLFFFLDLPVGNYSLLGFMPRQGRSMRYSGLAGEDQQDPFERNGDKRYGKTQYDASVSYEGERFDKLAVLRLPPTAIRGRVVTSANQTGLLMAEVRVKGSGECAFTNGQGQYTITGIQPDKVRSRVLEVRARGYRDHVIEVTIDEPGTCKLLKDVSLVAERG